MPVVEERTQGDPTIPRLVIVTYRIGVVNPFDFDAGDELTRPSGSDSGVAPCGTDRVRQ
jgi:hypothetical protein